MTAGYEGYMWNEMLAGGRRICRRGTHTQRIDVRAPDRIQKMRRRLADQRNCSYDSLHCTNLSTVHESIKKRSTVVESITIVILRTFGDEEREHHARACDQILSFCLDGVRRDPFPHQYGSVVLAIHDAVEHCGQ